MEVKMVEVNDDKMILWLDGKSDELEAIGDMFIIGGEINPAKINYTSKGVSSVRLELIPHKLKESL